MNKTYFHLSVFLFLSIISSSSSFAADKPTEWQSLFPNVPVISLSEIEQQRDKIVMIDVRAKNAFDQQHKEGLKHVSFSSRMFMLSMEGLIEKHQDKTIVVYCDADNCIKSYRAVAKCQQAEMQNVVLFDLNRDMAELNQGVVYSQL